MSNRNYWVDLFSGTSWQEFLDAGAEVSGFNERRWRKVQQIKPGDYLLCYMTGISRWIAILEVISEAFKDSTPIWKDAEFPCRLKVTIVASLTPETAAPVLQLDVVSDISPGAESTRLFAPNIVQRLTRMLESVIVASL